MSEGPSTNRDEKSDSNNSSSDLPSRRGFMRSASLAGVAAAALLGLADLAGVPAARADTALPRMKASKMMRALDRVHELPGKSSSTNCTCISATCICAAGNCGGPCPSGYWCNYCTGGCGQGYTCLKGACIEHSYGISCFCCYIITSS
jgi:hypothetical protein